jgi:signal transduction histidine kinase
VKQLLPPRTHRSPADAEARLRRSESDLRLLSAQLIAAQDMERSRIARELHDSIGQALGGIKYGLENCQALLAADLRDAAAANITTLTRKIQSVVEEVRRISVNLRPAALDELGVLPAINGLCREFGGLHPKIKFECVIELTEDQIPAAAKTGIYRIVQEAFSNAVSHGSARHICLTMHIEDDYLELRIRDDGVGFNIEHFTIVEADGRGLGLATMRERAEAAGAHLVLQSTRGEGTTVLVRWPVHSQLPKNASPP